MTSDAGVGHQVGLNYGSVMYKVWICTVIWAFAIGQEAMSLPIGCCRGLVLSASGEPRPLTLWPRALPLDPL